jgi:hypothetical protein
MARLSIMEQIESTLKAQLMDMPDGGAFHDNKIKRLRERLSECLELLATLEPVKTTWVYMLHEPQFPAKQWWVSLEEVEIQYAHLYHEKESDAQSEADKRNAGMERNQ